MKKITFVLTVALAILNTVSFGQIRKIPAEVTTAFSEKFPKASNVEWSDKITAFEATFEFNNKKTEASFSPKGEWKKTETTLQADEVPAAVIDGLSKSKYTDWENRSYVKVVDEKGTTYRVLVKKSDIQKKYLFFTPEGQLTRDAITL